MDVRTGVGCDAHKFGTAGKELVLCGVKIPFGRGLEGHSDGDVGIHAICDAIYGALAEGDIGTWFPSGERKWDGAESSVFLSHAVERAKIRRFSVNNIDCTLICEEPKIRPYSEKMRERLSEITGIDRARINVKATTTDTLGFTGRKEGIAAIATVSLIGL